MKQTFDTKNGSLVPMILPTGKTVEKSLPAVGHAMKEEGARIVDQKGEPIQPKVLDVRRVPQAAAYKAEVIDPGDQYKVCFDPNAGAHLAMVYKA